MKVRYNVYVYKNMKITQKTHFKFTLLTFAAFLSLGFVTCVVFSFVKKEESQLPPNVVKTQPIGKENSIGGQIGSKVSKESEEEQMSAEEEVSQTQSDETTKTTAFDPSPKQTQIKNSVEKEYNYTALRLPNDPYAQSNWSLNAMQAPSAWDDAVGNGVTVAVIDTGFGLSHEDLVDRWHENQGEIGQTQTGDRCWTGVERSKSTNNCDDDNNGYVDDFKGWDFANIDNSPMTGETNPDGQGVSHGTETAGLVGMTGNNAKGSATLGWDTTIMPLQALSDNGSGYTSSVIAAIYYAVDSGAEVINMSLGGYSLDPALQPAIDYAYQNDVVVVAAAGNCGTGQESGCNPSKPGAMAYPALNKHVISVGATNSGNTKASFSSYGPALDVVAPGSGSIVAPLWQQNNQTSSYAGTLYGTSFSSPYVASLVALVKSVRPDTTVDDITALVDGTAIKVGSMSGSSYTEQYGHGLVNAEAILDVAQSLNAESSVPTLDQEGSSVSQHGFTTSSMLGSGCNSLPNTYCSIKITNSQGDYERYLPYLLLDDNGQAGWSWQGSVLGKGEWGVRAVSGEEVSDTEYQLLNK